MNQQSSSHITSVMYTWQLAQFLHFMDSEWDVERHRARLSTHKEMKNWGIFFLLMPPPPRKKGSFWMLATTFCLSLPSLLSRQNDEVTLFSLSLSISRTKGVWKIYGRESFSWLQLCSYGNPLSFIHDFLGGPIFYRTVCFIIEHK